MAKGIVATQRRHCGEEGSHLEGTGLPPDLGEGLRPLDEVRRVRQRDEAVHYGHQPIAEVARKLSQNDEPEEEVEGEGDCRDVADEGEELDLLLVKVQDSPVRCLGADPLLCELHPFENPGERERELLACG